MTVGTKVATYNVLVVERRAFRDRGVPMISMICRGEVALGSAQGCIKAMPANPISGASPQ